MEKVERTLIETCNIWEKRLDSKQPSQSSGISPQHVRGGGSDPDPDQIRSDQIRFRSRSDQIRSDSDPFLIFLNKSNNLFNSKLYFNFFCELCASYLFALGRRTMMKITVGPIKLRNREPTHNTFYAYLIRPKNIVKIYSDERLLVHCSLYTVQLLCFMSL